jgi:fructokinase
METQNQNPPMQQNPTPPKSANTPDTGAPQGLTIGAPTIGIDIGGTKIASAFCRWPYEQTEQQAYITPTPTNDYPAFLEEIHRHVEYQRQQISLPHDKAVSTGISVAGIIDPHSGIVRLSPNIPCLTGKSVLGDLQTAHKAPITILNDATALAGLESTIGAGKDHEIVVGIILGTGVGAGIAIHGKALIGSDGGAGEFGQILLPGRDDHDPPDSSIANAKLRSTIDQLCSGPALERQVKKLHGKDLKAAEIVALAEKDPAMMATLKAFYHTIAKGLSVPLYLLNPDIMVLGGGLSEIKDLPLFLKRELDQLPGGPFQTKIVKAKFGTNAGTLAAARIAAGLS